MEENTTTNNETVTMTGAELDALLKEAARRGAEEAMSKNVPTTPEPDESRTDDEIDARTLEFIATFPPQEEKNTVSILGKNIQNRIREMLGGIPEKIDKYNEFEAMLEPYYEFADDPEDREDELSEEELKHYCAKHEIYLTLRREKFRRFGIWAFNRGKINVESPLVKNILK